MDLNGPKTTLEHINAQNDQSETGQEVSPRVLKETGDVKVHIESKPSPSTTMADESLDFSEEDIRRQLEALGYYNVPPYRLREFASDLKKLVEHEKSSSRSSFRSDSFVSSTDGEGYHMLHRHRIPLNESRSRQPNVNNQSIVEHSVFGKENSHGLSKSDFPEGTSLVGDHEDLIIPDHKPIIRSPDRKVMRKRKVVRKVGGHSQVFDESITESEQDDVSILRDRFDHLPIREDDASSVTESETSADVIQQIYSRRPFSARPDLFPDSSRVSREEDSIYAPNLPRSFIRPGTAHPHTKNLRKTDPVTRYHLYQQSWNSYKVPGEKNRKELRWAVREQMLHKDEVYRPKRDQKVFVPNKYVVPTDKKRQALRWEIRTDMAHCQMPASGRF